MRSNPQFHALIAVMILLKDGGAAAVHIHGFTTLPDGGQEYSDDPAHIDGWSSMVRIETPDDPQQPFDIVLEMDHDTKDRAEARARMLAHALFGDIDQWSEY